MSKVAVVYWSGTGNTEIMANKVAEGAKAGGAEVEVFEAEGFSADKMDEFDAVAFGCPSMGCEELEDTIFEPDVCFLRIQTPGQEDCTVWFLRMGRWRMDAELGRNLQKRRCVPCM